MAVFRSPLAKAEDEYAVAKRRVVEFEGEAVALAERNLEDLDFDTRFKVAEQQAHTERKLAMARDEVTKIEGRLLAAKAAEAEAEKDCRHREGEKSALVVGTRLAENVETAVSQLVAALAASEAHRSKIAALNAERGNRPPILNGEERLRGTPARTEPAQFEVRELWVDAQGDTPGRFQLDSAGQQVPADHGKYTRKRVKVQTRAERFVPARTPSPYAATIKLVDRAGQAIWPPVR